MCIVYRMLMAESPMSEGYLHRWLDTGTRVLRELLEKAPHQEVFINCIICLGKRHQIRSCPSHHITQGCNPHSQGGYARSLKMPVVYAGNKHWQETVEDSPGGRCRPGGDHDSHQHQDFLSCSRMILPGFFLCTSLIAKNGKC